MAIQYGSSGQALGTQHRAPAAKVIAGALANGRVARALISALGSYSASAVIIATNVSQTVDFATLLPGDVLLQIPAIPGGVSFASVVAAGTAPAAAVVGDLYLVMRFINLDANNPLVPAEPGSHNARETGDGGTRF